MSRRRPAVKREIAPDPKFGNKDLASFINRVMYGGKKSVAQRAVYQAFDLIQEQTNRDPLEIFDQAMRNATPTVEVKPRRVGGATYQVPIEVAPNRRMALAMRWLIRGARARTGQPMRSRLAAELLDASRGQGSAVRRREELYKVAEANRAFVHYKW
jgi:small subunit ribosomal protein S7